MTDPIASRGSPEVDAATLADGPVVRRDPMLGRAIGGYEIRACIGTGGMGAVYVAAHPTLGRRVAVKLMLATSSSSAAGRRFLDEARALASLDDPHVVAVQDFARLPDGSAYIVMEHLEGESLAAVRARAAPLCAGEAVAIVAQLLEGLQAAHARGIVHRDVKPGNVFLARGAEGRAIVKILDFGVAKLTESATGATLSHATIGTPSYMSPEQASGRSRDVDARSDVYSAGALLYTLLARRTPFQGDAATLLRAHREALPPPLTGLPGVSEELDRAVRRALAKRPDDRFESAAAMREAIVAALGGPLPPLPSPRVEEVDAGSTSATSATSTTPSPLAMPSSSPPRALRPDPAVQHLPPASSREGEPPSSPRDARRATSPSPDAPSRRVRARAVALAVALGALASIAALGGVVGLDAFRARAKSRAPASAPKASDRSAVASAASSTSAAEAPSFELRDESGVTRTFGPPGHAVAASATLEEAGLVLRFATAGEAASEVSIELTIAGSSQRIGTSPLAAGSKARLIVVESTPPRRATTYAAIGTRALAPIGSLTLVAFERAPGARMAGTADVDLRPQNAPSSATAVHLRVRFDLEL